MSLEDICVYHELSRVQRQAELDRGAGLEGTMSYELTGCYQCNGYNAECITYLNQIMIKQYGE